MKVKRRITDNCGKTQIQNMLITKTAMLKNGKTTAMKTKEK